MVPKESALNFAIKLISVEKSVLLYSPLLLSQIMLVVLAYFIRFP